jgi:methylmalonyl-CoA epimerase
MRQPLAETIARVDLAIYRNALGMPLAHRETVTEQGVHGALLDVGDGHVELPQPLSPGTPVGKFPAKRRPGLHHVAYRVGDVDEALAALEGIRDRLIDERPRTGIRGRVRLPLRDVGGRRADRNRPTRAGSLAADEKPQGIVVYVLVDHEEHRVGFGT